jgi:hypothetical protein
MRLSVLILSLSLLAGCSKPPVVFPCPPPHPVTRPSLRVNALTAQAAPDAVLEAYVLDLADWVGYSKELETLLDAYRPAPTVAPAK